MRRPRVLFLICATIGSGPVHSARADVTPISFADRALLPAIGRVTAFGDLDGNLGAEIVGVEGSTIGILRNLGGRSFAPMVSVSMGGTLRGAKLLDFNQDGRLDLAGLRASPPRLLLRRNSGNLGFDALVAYPIPIEPRSIETGDLDGDGWPDLLIACRDSLAAFLTTSTGSLLSVRTPLIVGDRAVVGLGDLDGDAVLDAAFFIGTYPTWGLDWRRGNGDGTFGAPQALPSASVPEQIVLADLDLDGDRELICARYDGVYEYRNDGTGVFAPPVRLDLPAPSGSEPARIAVVDMDRDGVPDVLAALRVSGYVRQNSLVFLLRAPFVGGTSSSPRWHVPYEPASFAAGDLDGDGYPEAVVGCIRSGDSPYSGSSDPSTAVLWNDAHGRLMGKLEVPVGLSSGPGLPDQHGLLASRSSPGVAADLVAGNGGRICLLRNVGNGTFFAPEDIGRGEPRATGDLDHDGDQDVVVATNDSAWVQLRAGAGGFGPPGPIYSGLRLIGLADFNGDGHPDLGLMDAALALWIRPGDGAGGFGPPAALGATLTTANAVPWLGDLNGDGFAEVAWAEGPALLTGFGDEQEYRVPVRVTRNDGASHLLVWDVDTLRTFGNGHAHNPGALEAGDVDGDGDLDLVLMIGGKGSVSLGWWGALLNAGDGTFSVPFAARFGGNPGGEMVVADMNGDGLADVMIHEYDGLDFDFHVLPSLGGGLFGPWYYLVGTHSPRHMLAEDLDGDGRRDVALYDLQDGSIAVMRNVSVLGAPTPALVSSVAARVEGGAIELEWYSPDEPGFQAAIERASRSGEAWNEVATVAADGLGHVRWRDADVRAGERYGYRLRYHDGGVERLTEEVWVEVPLAPLSLRISVAGPQPVSGTLAFDLALPGVADVSLEILDVGGRRLGVQRARIRAAGTERLNWDGAALRPGLYFGRAVTASQSAVVRFAVVR